MGRRRNPTLDAGSWTLFKSTPVYRSPARVAWTPSGTNVPDYPKLAQLW